jgi:hypothetical protein
MLFNPETLKLLSVVLDDVCGHVSDEEARTYVAMRLLEAAGDGERSTKTLNMEILTQVATLALLEIYARTWADEDNAIDAMTQDIRRHEQGGTDQPLARERSTD